MTNYDRDASDQEMSDDVEPTAFLPEMSDELPELPDGIGRPSLPQQPPPMPADPLERPHTREHFAISPVADIDDHTARPAITNERLRQPAPRRKRPTMMPQDMPRAPKARRSQSVMQPVRGRQDLSRPDIGMSSMESSDVVKTFESGEQQATPRPLSGALNRPARKHLVRKPAVTRRPTAGRRPQRPAPAAPAPRSHVPDVLPLNAEALAQLISEQRRHLKMLDTFARGLEVGAGVLGTLSLAVLIAALVSILVGTDVSVLNASSALVSSVSALAITLVMVVTAGALRQMAHMSAQLAALLDALSKRR